MKVIVVANVEQREEIISKITSSLPELYFLKGFSDPDIHGNYNAVFVLLGDIDFSNRKLNNGKTVFINSVVETPVEKEMPFNVSGINGCPCYLKRQKWEVGFSRQN